MNAIEKFNNLKIYLEQRKYLEKFEELKELKCNSVELVFNLEKNHRIKIVLKRNDLNLSEFLDRNSNIKKEVK